MVRCSLYVWFTYRGYLSSSFPVRDFWKIEELPWREDTVSTSWAVARKVRKRIRRFLAVKPLAKGSKWYKDSFYTIGEFDCSFVWPWERFLWKRGRINGSVFIRHAVVCRRHHQANFKMPYLGKYCVDCAQIFMRHSLRSCPLMHRFV